jgi:hypothetical protein
MGNTKKSQGTTAICHLCQEFCRRKEIIENKRFLEQKKGVFLVDRG